jgi:hypothetical protein
MSAICNHNDKHNFSTEKSTQEKKTGVIFQDFFQFSYGKTNVCFLIIDYFHNKKNMRKEMKMEKM